MHPFLQLFLWFPLLTFLASMLVPKKKEKIISWLAILSIGIYLAGIVLFILAWFLNNQPTLDVKYFVLFRKDDIEIFIGFYFDRITAVFAFMCGLVSILV